ncbi:MAG: peptidase M16 [Gammaproteobacteria bacterium]|nr:peptidase M16 [Gammaproteobacteria bacterium]
MTHPAFEFLHQTPIPTLNLTVEEYRHRVTRARHFHLESKDSNNAFLVAFPTVPQDSTGVAHILEHTTLCGSRRYPVRDPFFMMIRRSLNTFMNAFTATDWTAYPFASQNRKDFDNLIQVYLDAVFFPILDPLDFSQEGHRVEFSVAQDPNSDLVYKGVVYNEMKGAMSAPERQVWQTLQSNLFPTITYHYNSGGEPSDIPKLSHEQLKAFHRRHYHPSNAVFLTYGNFAVEDQHARMEECALRHFDPQDLDFTIPDEQRYSEPVVVESSYSLDNEDDLSNKTHVVMGWLLGKSTDLREMISAELLSGVLLDNSASPLRKALETSDLGTAPSELCGLDTDTREAMFVCGLEGSDPDQAPAAEELILGVLQDVAEHGVPQAQVEAVLHQLELSQREIGGGRFPFGLQLMVKALSPVLHGADPAEILNIDPILNELHEKIKDPRFIKSLARKLLLNNPHRVRLTMVPDPAMSSRMKDQEKENLANIRAAMSEQDSRRVLELASTLKHRQEAADDPEILPKVTQEDVPDTIKIPVGEEKPVADMAATWFAQGTNGLVYEQIILDLPQLEPELMELLPLYCACLTEVGSAGRDYLQTQALQASFTGGIGSRASVRASLNDIQRVKGLFVLSGKALLRNQQPLAQLLEETLDQARFDELPRLRELIAQIRGHRESQVTDSGHVLALTAASAGMGPCGHLAQHWGGLQSIQQIKALDKALEAGKELKSFAAQLERIRDTLIDAPRQLLVVSEASQQEAIHTSLNEQWAGWSNRHNKQASFAPQPVSFTVHQAWATNTQVNFCAKAYPTVAQEHPDAPALTVLGPFLRNGYLHRTIREQGGAYGSGAGYHNDTSAFRFFSYRDPRLEETLEDFDRALEWLQSERHEPRLLEEAILGIISDIDRPDSPAGEAIGTYFAALHGRTTEQRLRFRKQILQVKLEDLQRVAQKYLLPEVASIAVISSPQTLQEHSQLGLEIHDL